jgi:exonuclease III
MCDKNIDLIAFNETRLDLHISDGLIHIDGYEVVRKDRSRNGGGVCIYLRSSINYKIRSDLIPPELEAVCLEITKPQSRPFIVTTIYRPPNATAEFFDHLVKLIKQTDDENKEMYILGDLNCNLLQEKPLLNIPTKKLDSYELYISINPIDQ